MLHGKVAGKQAVFQVFDRPQVSRVQEQAGRHPGCRVGQLCAKKAQNRNQHQADNGTRHHFGHTGHHGKCCFPYKGGKKDISADVKALREAGCQIVIASFHWGSEYRDDFTGEQRTIGRAAIKAGADIVVGTHPHIVQGIEAYQDSYILYSLGNLVFGGNVDPDDRDAYLARVTFTVYEDHCDAPELTVVPIRLTALDKGIFH